MIEGRKKTTTASLKNGFLVQLFLGVIFLHQFLCCKQSNFSGCG